MKIEVGGRKLTFAVRAASTVLPALDERDDSVVWYRSVLPGVDARFRLSASGIEQDFVLQSRDAAAALDQLVLGYDGEGVLLPAPQGRPGQVIDWDANGKTAFEGDADGPHVHIDDPVVFDAQGRPLPGAKASLTSDETESLVSKGARRDRDLRFGFAAGFADELSDAQFPVTIDPTITFTPSGLQSYSQSGVITGGAQKALVGNWRAGGLDDQWRFNISFDYSPIWTTYGAGARVVSANMKMVNASNPNAVAPVFDTQWASYPTSATARKATVCHASAWTWAGAYPGLDYCDDWSWSGTTPVLDSVGGSGATTYVDVTDMVRPWVVLQSIGVFGVVLDTPAGEYNFKATVPSLEVVWDTPSPAATLVSPADGATVPTGQVPLQVNAVTDTDAGQTPQQYEFVGLLSVWLTFDAPGGAGREGCPHAQEVPCGVQA